MPKYGSIFIYTQKGVGLSRLFWLLVKKPHPIQFDTYNTVYYSNFKLKFLQYPYFYLES